MKTLNELTDEAHKASKDHATDANYVIAAAILEHAKAIESVSVSMEKFQLELQIVLIDWRVK